MIVEQMLMGPLSVFSYVVGCEKDRECVIIDPAGSAGKILSKADALGLRVKYVVNTHGHADHTSGNGAILARTGARLVAHREDAPRIAGGMNKFFSLAFGKRPSPGVHVQAKEGDFLKIGETGLEIIHTPGHTPGSICLYGEGNLFTGDTLFAGGVGRTDLKGGSHKVLLDSLRRLLLLPPETRVWPGHHYGDRRVSTLSFERANNPYLSDLSP